MVAFTSDQWVILALVFVLGFLVGAFLLAGSGRKWKHRYRNEVRERDSLRGAAIKERDRDGDGVPDRTEY
jgi:hypothetical protein